jgi:hypothetical protein
MVATAPVDHPAISLAPSQRRESPPRLETPGAENMKRLWTDLYQ